ncbi:hypothetical protein K438DRAFT_1785239 [Mycena galopus ATCC 62051]|nr:hypothetical protein K438DRAFT_1785239 [Mycena galopus ATCC 62051]
MWTVAVRDRRSKRTETLFLTFPESKLDITEINHQWRGEIEEEIETVAAAWLGSTSRLSGAEIWPSRASRSHSGYKWLGFGLSRLEPSSAVASGHFSITPTDCFPPKTTLGCFPWQPACHEKINAEDEKSIKKRAPCLQISHPGSLRARPRHTVYPPLGKHHATHDCQKSVEFRRPRMQQHLLALLCSDAGSELDAGSGTHGRLGKGTEHPDDAHAQEIFMEGPQVVHHDHRFPGKYGKAGSLRHREDAEGATGIARCPMPCFSKSRHAEKAMTLCPTSEDKKVNNDRERGWRTGIKDGVDKYRVESALGSFLAHAAGRETRDSRSENFTANPIII